MSALLLDENLSPRPGVPLAGVFTQIEQVRNVGLSAADDLSIWQYAAIKNRIIVTEDEDFEHLSAARRHPPRVVRPRLGNASTETVRQALTLAAAAIERLANDPHGSMLVIE